MTIHSNIKVKPWLGQSQFYLSKSPRSSSPRSDNSYISWFVSLAAISKIVL